MIRAPDHLLKNPYNQRSIPLDGCTLVESCTHEEFAEGSMFLAEHALLFILEGRYIIQADSQQILVDKNEAVIIKKANIVEYQKIGYLNGNPYSGIMFFLQDSFLKDFVRVAKVKQKQSTEQKAALKIWVDEKLMGFIESIKPYFSESLFDQPALLRIKIMELLYNLSISNEDLIPHLMQFSGLIERSIVEVMEDNFKAPFKLEDFADLTGRSLSSFKRDFFKIYGTSPAKWIVEKKLAYARNLLKNTDMSVTDVCYEAGFENTAHFSRLFKQRFGISPSQAKVEPQSQQP